MTGHSEIVPERVDAPIRATLATESARIFLDCADAVYTRGEFLRAAEAGAAALQAQGIKLGDRVLLTSGADSVFWVNLAAAWFAGAVPVPVAQQMTDVHAESIVTKAGPSLIMRTDERHPDAFKTLPVFQKIADAVFSVPAITPQDQAAVLFTSGSTGQPKGVKLSGRSLTGNSRGILSVLDLRDGDRLFISIPSHFTSAINHFIACGLTGATLVSREQKLMKADLHKFILNHDITCFGGAPMQLRWLAECAEITPMPRLRWVMSSGDALPVEVIRALHTFQPNTAIFTVYGLTELGGRFCILPSDALPAHAGAVGRPMLGLTATIRDEAGAALEDGEEGEIYADGAFLFDGYINDPEASQHALTPFGMRTGDIGYVDKAGYLRLVGRADDIFKVSGQKVSASEIGRVAMMTGLFEDVAAMPMPHPVAGSAPVLFYTMKDGQAFDKGAVVRAIRAALPANHVPQAFVPTQTIPRTGSGKLQRGQLRQLVAALASGKESAA
tara:strand:- start:94558 stop:96057 length:1500 start_codon:yes stop_codon:yes gene_type:complete